MKKQPSAVSCQLSDSTPRSRVVRVLAVLAVLALGAPGAAFAQEAAPKKKDAKAKDRDKEKDKKPTAKESEKKGPAKIEIPKEEKEVSKDAQADLKRDEAIKMLQEISARFPTGPRKADVMFQLAELYWEKSKYLYFKEMHKYNQDVEDCQKKSKDYRKCEDLKINTRQSELYRKQALDIYQKIIKEYPDYPRKDEVLFVLGYNLYEMGKKTDGIKFYWDLIKQFPKSKFAPDAYLALGEHFFNNNEVFKAVQAYQKALGYQDQKIYVFALYKLAWCDFNLGEYDKGIEKLKQVVEIAEGEERSKIQLKREALNDLSLFFAYVDAVDEARDYFERAAGKSAVRELVKRLARIYEEQGKNDQAVKTFRMLINEFPNDPDAPSFQSSIIHAFKRVGQKDQVQKEIRRLVDLYRPKSPWAQANAGNEKAIVAAYELTENALRDIVQEYHQEAQKTKDARTYRLARDIYKEYLGNFPDAEHAYRLRFFYAEILYALEEYEKAAEQYSAVVDKNKKGEFSEKSAYNAVLALQRLVEAEAKGQAVREKADREKIDEKKQKEGIKQTVNLGQMKLQEGKKYDKKEIPSTEKKLATACDRFTEFYPKNAEFFAVKFKTAHIYYKYNHFDEASKRFGEFIDRYPENKYSQYAADLILDSYNIKEDWKNVHYWAKRFTEIKKLASQPDENNKKQTFLVHLNEVVEGARFKIAMDVMDKEQKKEDAAVAFRAFVADFPESKHGLKALYNAMVLFSDVMKLDKAIETGSLILAKYVKETPGAAKPVKITVGKEKKEKKAPKPAKPPKPGKGKEAAAAAEAAKEEKAAETQEIDPIERTRFLMATYHEKTSDFKGAAEFYEKYFDKYPKTKDAPDALYNAALFREAMGDHNRAIENYGRYVKEYPLNKDNPDINFKIGKIYQKREDWPKAKGIFQGFLDKYGRQVTTARNIEAEYELAMTLRKMDQRAASEKELEKVVKLGANLKKGEVNEKVFFMIAHARFLLVEPLYREFEAVKLELPQAKMKTQLKAKSDKLIKLVDEKSGYYIDILKMGQGDMGVASLCRIGLVYQNFARSLFDAPVPRELNEEQRAIYQAELSNMAFPVEEKAIEAFEMALKKAYELGVYNEWTLLAQESYNKYKPGAYPDLPPTRYVAKEYFYDPPIMTAAAGQAPDLLQRLVVGEPRRAHARGRGGLGPRELDVEGRADLLDAGDVGLHVGRLVDAVGVDDEVRQAGVRAVAIEDVVVAAPAIGGLGPLKLQGPHVVGDPGLLAEFSGVEARLHRRHALAAPLQGPEGGGVAAVGEPVLQVLAAHAGELFGVHPQFLLELAVQESGQGLVGAGRRAGQGRDGRRAEESQAEGPP